MGRVRPTIANELAALARSGSATGSEEVIALASQSYPVMHERGLSLCRDLLRYKREHGSPAERDLHVGHDLDELALVDRLLSKVMMMPTSGLHVAIGHSLL